MPDLDPVKGECCGVGENLELEKAADLSTALIKEYRCRVCGRLHRRMTVKPIEIKLPK